MDNEKLMLRTAALQLQTTESKEVVKIAGIVRSLQHWLKKVTDPEYRARVLKMDTDTKEVQKFISELDTELNHLRAAIRTGDLAAYDKALNAARALSLGFWAKIKEVSREAEPVSKVMKYYTKQDIGRRDFMKKFKTHLPPEYDLELDGKKRYNVPLKSVGWYKALTSDMIVVTGAGTIVVLTKTIQGKLGSLVGADKLDFTGDKLETLINNVREAIVNGTLIGVSYRKVAPNQKMVEWGTTEIEVATAPFEIPETGAAMSLVVTLADPRTSRARTPDDKLVWVTSRAPRVVRLPSRKVEPTLVPAAAAGTRKQLLEKFAFIQELPVEYTTLSEVQLAQVLREGYRMAFGTDPTAQALAGGWAQTVLESGRPVKLPNNNIGNIKATPDWLKSGKSYFTKSTIEYNRKGKQYTHHDAKWRAYSTPQEGAAGYWKLIGNKYKDAMDWMAAGDPNSATVSLAMNRYFTANIEKYAKGVSSLYQEFMTKIAPQLPNLRSAVASPPGEKLSLKPWLENYHQGETTQAPAQTPAISETSPKNEVDTLLQTLYAEPGTITKFVKEALLEQTLPRTNFVILVQGTEVAPVDKLEYARVTAGILKQHLEVTAEVHTDGTEVEIQGSTLGRPLTVTSSVQAVCDCLSDSLSASTTSLVSINAVVVPGFISKYSQANIEEIDRNRRLFQLKRLG
jgi:hypothetical protein